MTTALLPIYERDLTLVKGKGSRLFDSEGREWLDFAAGIAVNGFGYGDRKIVAAIKKQAETLMHTSNLFHNEPATKLAERLVRIERGKIYLIDPDRLARQAGVGELAVA